ncbi:hypothetical protein HPB47_013033, partial [Ixodes persulcatus]
QPSRLVHARVRRSIDRQLLPAPHPNLTRKEAVVFRQLQTRCMFTPVIGKHILPDLFQDDVCKLCKRDRATLAHIAWDGTKRRREASQEADLPPELKDATESDHYEVQLQAVQQIAALLERQSPRRVLATTLANTSLRSQTWSPNKAFSSNVFQTSPRKSVAACSPARDVYADHRLAVPEGNKRTRRAPQRPIPEINCLGASDRGMDREEGGAVASGYSLLTMCEERFFLV